MGKINHLVAKFCLAEATLCSMHSFTTETWRKQKLRQKREAPRTHCLLHSPVPSSWAHCCIGCMLSCPVAFGCCRCTPISGYLVQTKCFLNGPKPRVGARSASAQLCWLSQCPQRCWVAARWRPRHSSAPFSLKLLL